MINPKAEQPHSNICIYNILHIKPHFKSGRTSLAYIIFIFFLVNKHGQFDLCNIII